MSSTPILFKLLNPLMEGVLKSPFHSLVSDRIMLITFTGRKSGQIYSTPVSYCQENGTVVGFTHAGWWVNLVGGSRVRLRIRGRKLAGTATAIRDDQERKMAGLSKLLAAVPADARFYGVTVDSQGQLDPKELALAADNATMIHIRLDG